MKKEKILKKAIEKAVENGFDLCGWMNDNNINFFGTHFISSESGWTNIFVKMANQGAICLLLFSHEFAKAFWKHSKECKIPKAFCSKHAGWQYRLQQMVLLTDDEKFKYLEKFL